MYSVDEIINTARMLGIDFSEFSLQDLITGINIELEHEKVNPKTNVTDDNLLMTMKIALTHLNEFPDYYNQDYGLPAMERYLESNKRNNRL